MADSIEIHLSRSSFGDAAAINVGTGQFPQVVARIPVSDHPQRAPTGKLLLSLLG